MNIDLNKYFDYQEVVGYDLFISKDGGFYKIKKVGLNYPTHNDWAYEFLKAKNINIKDSKFRSVSEFMIHQFGLLYYSHDGLLYKPIIKTPNPKYDGKYVTEEQLDSLFSVMIMNRENPYNVPMLLGNQDVFDYVEQDDGKINRMR